MGMCKVEECAGEEYKKGYCTGHYFQQYRAKRAGKEVKFSQIVTRPTLDLSNDSRECRQCHRTLELTYFYKYSTGKPFARCKMCLSGKNPG
jgi:hypothetical protein